MNRVVFAIPVVASLLMTQADAVAFSWRPPPGRRELARTQAVSGDRPRGSSVWQAFGRDHRVLQIAVGGAIAALGVGTALAYGVFPYAAIGEIARTSLNVGSGGVVAPVASGAILTWLRVTRQSLSRRSAVLLATAAGWCTGGITAWILAPNITPALAATTGLYSLVGGAIYQGSIAQTYDRTHGKE